MVTKHAFMKAVLEGVSKGGKGAAKFFGQTAAKNIGTVTGDAARHAGGAAKWVAQNPGASLGIAGAGLGGYAMGKSGSYKSKEEGLKDLLKFVSKGGKGAAKTFGEVADHETAKGTITGYTSRQARNAAKWVEQNPGVLLSLVGAGLGGYAMGKSGSSKKKDDEVDKAIEEIKGPKKVNEVLPEVSKDKRDDVLRELRQEKIGMQTTIGWK